MTTPLESATKPWLVWGLYKTVLSDERGTALEQKLPPREKLRFFLTHPSYLDYNRFDKILPKIIFEERKSPYYKYSDYWEKKERVSSYEQKVSTFLTSFLKKRDQQIEEICESDDPKHLDLMIESWNLSFREVSPQNILDNWCLYQEACVVPEEELKEALKTVDRYHGLYQHYGLSLRAAFKYVREQYSQSNILPFISDSSFRELSQAIIQVIHGLDLPSLITEPLRQKIEGNNNPQEVTNLIEAWKTLEDPFSLVSPQVENTALDLILRLGDKSFHIINHSQRTFRYFCHTLEELHLAATHPVSAWGQLERTSADDILKFITQNPLGNYLAAEILFLIDNNFLIFPYQFQRYLDTIQAQASSLYEALEKDYQEVEKNHKPSRLFSTIAYHRYSVSSSSRAKEYRNLPALLTGINLSGTAVDIGSSIPICLLTRCQDLEWLGPVISVDRIPLTRELFNQTVFYRDEFGERKKRK